MKIKILTIGLLLITLGCAKDEGPTGPSEDDGSTEPSLEYFPNTIGYVWQYQISYTNGPDEPKELTVRIDSSGYLPNGRKVNQWVYEYSDTIVIFYLYSDSTEVRKYNSLQDSSEGCLIYEIPLVDSLSWWETDFHMFYHFVEGQEDVQVPADTFYDSYKINVSWCSIGGGDHIDKWFKPNIGLIKECSYCFYGADYVMELINYDLK